MRVGIVTTSYPRDDDDPAGNFVLGHARWLAAAGHHVEVIAAGDAAADAGRNDAIAVTRVATGSAGLFYGGGAPEALSGRSWRWLGAASSSAAMVAAIARRARHWDGVFAHWIAPSGLAVAMAAPRVPACVIAHSGDVHLLRRLHLVRPAVRLLERANLVFVSAHLRERFCAALPAARAGKVQQHSVVCPMGIDVARFARLADHSDTAQPPTVLFLGRLVEVKGVATLIDAVARLERPLRLRIAGDGPERAALIARAGDLGVDAEIVGEVRGAARDQVLASASVVVLPSTIVAGGRTEGAPVTALEALAAGVPVIASAVGGLTELPDAAVRFVPPDRPGALADAIAASLSDPTAGASRIAAGRVYAAGYDWSQVGPTLLNQLHRRVN